MIIIGVDPHPSTHTAVALNESRAVLGQQTVPNTAAGIAELLGWAAQFEQPCWAIEGSGNRYVKPLRRALRTKGDTVVSVHPSLTSQYRSRRGPKKNDVIDAQNVGLAYLANPDLPGAQWDEQRDQLQMISRTRDDLAVQRKANKMALDALPAAATTLREALQAVVDALDATLTKLQAALRPLVEEIAPTLLKQVGIATVLASAFLAEVGDIRRFPNADKFASYCGAAPMERSSGKNMRWCVNTRGNRRLNRVLHLIALTRLRVDERTKVFAAKKKQEGKTQRGVLRILKTYIARELFRLLQPPRTPHSPFPPDNALHTA